MGGDLQIEQWEQGWSFSPDVYICHRCVSDPELVQHVKEDATEYKCDFCDRTARKHPISIEFDSLMEIIGSTLTQYFDRAVNELGYCSAEGGYLGTTYDSYDIIHEHSPFCEISDNDRVLGAITESLSDEEWCDKSPYSTIGFDAYMSSWDRFCEAVKHHTRYFFTQRNSSDEDSDLTPVSKMLGELSSHLEREELIESVGQSAKFVRIRAHKREEKCVDWKSLGSPPPNVAPSNRMSPAGISMFYCSETLETAKAEARSTLRDEASSALTAATWSPSRTLLLLNLSDMRETPSFWFSHRSDRDRVLFLKAFAESISQPVTHDGREHIDYVPSQIVTEYFRHVYRTDDGKQLDGIIFPSARVRKAKNFVIFASSHDLRPVAEKEFDSTPSILTLDPSSIKRLRIRR